MCAGRLMHSCSLLRIGALFWAEYCWSTLLMMQRFYSLSQADE